jgi:hypothetical protein
LPETEHVLYIRGLDVQANKSNVLLQYFVKNVDNYLKMSKISYQNI